MWYIIYIYVITERACERTVTEWSPAWICDARLMSSSTKRPSAIRAAEKSINKVSKSATWNRCSRASSRTGYTHKTSCCKVIWQAMHVRIRQ